MKDISNLKNYREKYKRFYNIDFGREYAIHHIDFDRTNNDISNLLLLPRELHARYHFQKSIIDGQPLPTKITGNGLHSISYYLTCLESFVQTLQECNKWYDFKMFLDGAMPNIHNIQI